MASPTREDDERLLDVLARYRSGQKPAHIARALDMPHKAVSGSIWRVIVQDCQHDPEAHHYWRNRP